MLRMVTIQKLPWSIPFEEFRENIYNDSDAPDTHPVFNRTASGGDVSMVLMISSRDKKEHGVHCFSSRGDAEEFHGKPIDDGDLEVPRFYND